MENKEIYVYLGLIRIAILKNTDLEVLKYFILDEATKEDMAATQPSGDMIAFGMSSPGWEEAQLTEYVERF